MSASNIFGIINGAGHHQLTPFLQANAKEGDTILLDDDPQSQPELLRWAAQKKITLISWLSTMDDALLAAASITRASRRKLPGVTPHNPVTHPISTIVADQQVGKLHAASLDVNAKQLIVEINTPRSGNTFIVLDPAIFSSRLVDQVTDAMEAKGVEAVVLS